MYSIVSSEIGIYYFHFNDESAKVEKLHILPKVTEEATLALPNHKARIYPPYLPITTPRSHFLSGFTQETLEIKGQ